MPLPISTVGIASAFALIAMKSPDAYPVVLLALASLNETLRAFVSRSVAPAPTQPHNPGDFDVRQ